MFCRHCKRLQWTGKEYGGNSLHHASYDALVESATNGECVLCPVFLRAVHLHYEHYHPNPKEKTVERYHRELEENYHLALPFEIGHVVLGVDDNHGEPPRCWETTGLVGFTVSRGPCYLPYGEYKTFARVSVSALHDSEPFRYWQIFGRLPTASPDLQLAKTWLEECLQHHPKCSRPRTTIHPPRLLDLENAEDTPDLRLALRPMDRGPYATLSHCWGSSQPLRLLEANLEEFAACIRFARLPKTFQDAVTATRALGLRYLWIDSLCILQDSAADWEEHCSEMANIYRRSYVTLAGPISSSCDTGLLHTRPQIDDPVTLKLDDEGEEVEVQLDYHHLQGNSYYFGPEPDSPLSKRAWVFQERILSGRTLYFGKSRMYLECHTNVHFEDCHWPVQWDEDKVGGMVVKRSLQDVHPMSSDVFKYWYSLVSTYSGLDLTKQTDKLPAFSGMASLFGQILKDEYIAGHWREDLPRSLVWTVSPEDKVSGGPSKSGIAAETYIAPSWSWASSPWKVKIVPNSGRQFGPSVEIHDVKVAPTGQDARGMVQRGGYMDVSGLVMHGTVKRTGPRTGEFRSGRFTTDTVEWDWDDRGDGCGAVEGGDEFDVHLLQIGTCDYYHWMIIELVADAESGSENGGDCWRRIGMTSHYGREGKLEEVRRTEKEHKRLRLI